MFAIADGMRIGVPDKPDKAGQAGRSGQTVLIGVVGLDEAPPNFGNPLLELHLERVIRIDELAQPETVAPLELHHDHD